MNSDPTPLLAEARDICALILLEDALGTAGDEALGRGVRAILGRIRTLMIAINSPAAAGSPGDGRDAAPAVGGRT